MVEETGQQEWYLGLVNAFEVRFSLSYARTGFIYH